MGALEFCVVSCKELVVVPVVHPYSGGVRDMQLPCGLGLDLCFAAFFFYVSNYGLKLVIQTPSKAHQSIASWWGVRICLPELSQCDSPGLWSAVGKVLEGKKVRSSAPWDTPGKDFEGSGI